MQSKWVSLDYYYTEYILLVNEVYLQLKANYTYICRARSSDQGSYVYSPESAPQISCELGHIFTHRQLSCILRTLLPQGQHCELLIISSPILHTWHSYGALLTIS